MKPNFALSLSFEGIRLLHRSAGGWVFVDEVALDDPDLSDRLEAMRTRADELANGAWVTTKLVIPNDQIRYIQADLPADGPEREPAIRAALDGTTPYAVGDLVYDADTGTPATVAAVARETLQEAEGFATEHRFNPVSFVADPEGTDFEGEPFFGETAAATELLPRGGWVERDTAPARAADDTPLDSADDTPEDSAQSLPESGSRTPLVLDGDSVDAHEGEDLPAETPVLEPKPASKQEPAPDSEPRATIASDRADDEAIADPVSEPPQAEAADPPDGTAFSAAGAERLAGGPEPAENISAGPPSIPVFTRSPQGSAPPLNGAEREPLSVTAGAVPIVPGAPNPLPSEQATPITGVPDGALPEAEAIAEGLRAPAAPPRDTDQQAGLVGGFFSRRGRTTPQVEKEQGPPKVGPGPSRAAANPAEDTHDSSTPGVLGDPKSIEPRGKPRYLGIILTAILLVFLIAVAAWAAVFIEDGVARFFRNAPEPEYRIASAPAVVPVAIAPLDPGQSAPAEREDGGMPAAQDDVMPVSLMEPGSQAPETATTEPMSLPEAEARYAATGIWQRDPIIVEPSGTFGHEDIYIASIDPSVPAFDAVALPDPSRIGPDSAISPPSAPTPRGTVFDLDAAGLVRATPEGALSPEGIRVFAGRPARVPPPRPAAPELETAAPETDVTLAGFRPKTRPENLVELAERGQLSGRSRAELGALKPLVRPEVEKAVEEADETPTAQAVAASRVPSPRPNNFARVVDQIQKSSTAQVQTASASAAAAAPRSAAPSIPTRASVARQATVNNAINLRKINLIGVYGKPSSRRALVRLSNGRYIKVKVGDRVDGGQVAAIGERELRYVKRGRNVTLTMPQS